MELKFPHRLYIAISCVILALGSPSMAMDISQAVKKTLETHPDYHIQAQAVKIQQERHVQSQSGYRPKLNVQGSAGLEHTYYDSRDDEDLQPIAGSIVLTQPLFTGFRTRHALRKTMADRRAADLQLISAAEQIALEVVQAYLMVLSNHDIMTMAKENLEHHQHINSLIRDRLEEGVSDESDHAHAQGRLALAKSNYLSAKNNYGDAVSDFEAIAGFSNDDFEKPVLDESLIPESRDQTLQQGEKNHPLFKASVYAVKSAREQHEGIKSRYLPHLDAELKGTVSDEAGGVDQEKASASIMLVMNWNLYNGGSDDAEKRATLAQAEQAQNRSLQIRRKIDKEIRLAWAELQTTREQTIYMKEHVRTSEKARMLYRDQFDIHRRSLLDLLDTENELFQARRSFITTDYQELIARYRLLAATGRLVDSLGIQMDGGS